MKRRTRTGLVVHSRRDACIHNIWHDDADLGEDDDDDDGIAAKSEATKCWIMYLTFWVDILFI